MFFFLQVYFGTSNGQLVVMDVHGAMVAQVDLSSPLSITTMAWSCEKFKMEEGDDSAGNSLVFYMDLFFFFLKVFIQLIVENISFSLM